MPFLKTDHLMQMNDAHTDPFPKVSGNVAEREFPGLVHCTLFPQQSLQRRKHGDLLKSMSSLFVVLGP